MFPRPRSCVKYGYSCFSLEILEYSERPIYRSFPTREQFYLDLLEPEYKKNFFYGWKHFGKFGRSQPCGSTAANRIKAHVCAEAGALAPSKGPVVLVTPIGVTTLPPPWAKPGLNCEEVKAKISKALSGLYEPGSHYNLGKRYKRSYETKLKISQSKLGIKNPNEILSQT